MLIHLYTLNYTGKQTVGIPTTHNKLCTIYYYIPNAFIYECVIL